MRKHKSSIDLRGHGTSDQQRFKVNKLVRQIDAIQSALALELDMTYSFTLTIKSGRYDLRRNGRVPRHYQALVDEAMREIRGLAKHITRVCPAGFSFTSDFSMQNSAYA